jgi:hypothetical protein
MTVALPVLKPVASRPRLARAAVALTAVGTMLAGGLVAMAPAEAATSKPSTPKTSTITLGTTAHFDNFDVTVIKTLMDPDYYGYVIKLKVCVTKLPAGSTGGKTRISWDPWSVTTTKHTRYPSVQEDPPPDTFPRPYQSEGRFKLGECASGWLPFWSVTTKDKIISINYDNSLGDHARWAPTKKSLAIGKAKSFKQVKVLVSKVRRDEFWYGVKIKTCVASLPADKKSIHVGWDQWSLSTDQGAIPMAIAQEGVSPWSPVYPEAKRLKKGECIAAWLPFAAHDDVRVRKINYRSSTGDKVSWTAP